MKRILGIVGIAVATATLAASVPQGGTPPASTALILGQVVDVVTGKPIPEATVTVARGRAAGPALGGPGRLGGPVTPVRLLTGADGRFVVHDLPPGQVTITASASGYVQAAAGQARPTGPSRPVELDEGERVTDLKIRLWKHAVVTGTVVDENGEPAVGLTVRMLRQSMVNGRPQYLPGSLARTDDRGIYRISAITPGTFMMAVPQTVATMPTSTVDALMQTMASSMPQMGGMMELMGAGAQAPNMGSAGRRVGDLMVASPTGGLPPGSSDRVSVYQSIFYPAGATSAQGAAITLGSGEERSGVDFQLRVLPAVRVSGTVTAPDGPVAGVPVRLIPSGGLDFSSDNGIETATTTSAGDGTFQLLGVPTGQYTLSVFRPASPPMPAEMMNNPLMQFAGRGMSAAGQPFPLFAQTSLSVGGTDVTGVALTLAEGARLSGRVDFVGSAPIPAAAQLRNLNISLTAADGRPAPPVGGIGPNANGGADQDGQFKTFGYPPGRYVVSVAPVPAQWALRSATMAGRDVLEESFELKNSDISDVLISFTDRLSALTGNVRTAAGAASATATVLAFPADYQSWISSGMAARRARTSVATKKGAFTMNGLPPGDYLLAAIEDAELGDPRDPAFVSAVARVATKVTIAEGDRKTQDLTIVKVVTR